LYTFQIVPNIGRTKSTNVAAPTTRGPQPNQRLLATWLGVGEDSKGKAVFKDGMKVH
jgi:hypothetical protein